MDKLPGHVAHPLKQPLLPLPSPSSSSSPTPRSPRRSLPRWLIAILTCASLASLYLQFGPSHTPSTAREDRFLVRAYSHLRHSAGLDALPFTHEHCPHALKHKDGDKNKHRRKGLTQGEVEHLALTVPAAESARNASHSYTNHTHIAGTGGDKHVALALQAQWRALLGLPHAKDDVESHVWDAGTDADWEALTGERKGGKRCHGGKGVVERVKRKARTLLRRFGKGKRKHDHGKKGKKGDPSAPRVWTAAYWPLLNYPLSSSVVYTPASGSSEEGFRAKLRENAHDEDEATTRESVLPWHGFSRNGAAKGQLVYASKGAPEDYAELAAKGIDVKDKIVLVQYGGLFRGLKVKAAAEAGAKAVLIYTDPIEDGEITEENGHEAYPRGSAREPSSVQRGSVQYLSLYPGDPLTPEQPAYNPSLPNAPPRLPHGLTQSSSSQDSDYTYDLNLPPIPSLPLSYEDAVPLLKLLNGRGAKLEDGRDGKRAGWREGALGRFGVEYWTGPSEGEVEVVNETEEKVTPIWNTYALIPGHLSDEIVVLGNHHDAWTFGAGDPNSGTAAVHEVVRAFGTARAKGWKPLRTILIAGWDGEEYGLLGSTEFGEDFAQRYLQDRVVAYLNVDVGASGSDYSLAASPSLANLLRDVSARVPDPDHEGQTLAERAGKGEELAVGALGSGSDFTVFLKYGIASLNAGFDPSSTDPVYHYHSIYDSAYWMDTYGDPTFKRHEAVAKVMALATVKLAEDAVVPLNLTAYAVALRSYVDKVASLPEASSLDLTHLAALTHRIHSASVSLHAYASSLEHRLHASPGPSRKEALVLVRELRRVNRKLRGFERGLVGDNEGLKGREWYKHLGVAPGRWLGYGATTLPGLTESLTLDHDVEQAKHEVERLERAFEAILGGLKGTHQEQ